VYMRQEKLRLLAVHRHSRTQESTGWHSQHGHQENMCCTATRLFRKGTSPERGAEKEKSRAIVTLLPLYTENPQFSKTISTRFSGHVGFGNFIILVVVIIVCQFLFNDRRGCRATRSRGAIGAGASGVSRVEFQTERALVKGAVLAPVSQATAFKAGQVIRGVRWSKGTEDWGRPRGIRV